MWDSKSKKPWMLIIEWWMCFFFDCEEFYAINSLITIHGELISEDYHPESYSLTT